MAYAATVLCIVVAGLLWRRPELGLPPLVAKYGGSILWGAMVFVLAVTILPSAKLTVLARASAFVALGVECSQLVHFGWLDEIRRTTIGALLLGRTFSGWDVAAYWIGIAAVYALAVLAGKGLSASSS
jgi:hypothetical protein